MRFITSNMAQIIDGNKIAGEIRSELRKEVESIEKLGYRTPKLVTILVGEDSASQKYVENKLKAAKDVGIVGEIKKLPQNTSEKELLKIIEELNNDKEVDGILVQLPVPQHINEHKIFNAVSKDKDVDGFHEVNMGRVYQNRAAIVPATPLGVIELLKRSGIETFGKQAVVVGRSKNVGLPIAILLHSDGRNEISGMDATVTICHRFTPPKDLAQYCRMADIIVSAAGVPGLITKDMVKPGACIIDVGINSIKDEKTGKTKLVGDVDFKEVREVAGHITPVPGGVGPMTVAMVIKNTILSAKNIMGLTNSTNGHV